MSKNNDGLVSVEIQLSTHVDSFIQLVARNSGVTKDQAASVIALLAVSRYLGIPLAQDDAKDQP